MDTHVNNPHCFLDCLKGNVETFKTRIEPTVECALIAALGSRNMCVFDLTQCWHHWSEPPPPTPPPHIHCYLLPGYQTITVDDNNDHCFPNSGIEPNSDRFCGLHATRISHQEAKWNSLWWMTGFMWGCRMGMVVQHWDANPNLCAMAPTCLVSHRKIPLFNRTNNHESFDPRPDKLIWILIWRATLLTVSGWLYWAHVVLSRKLRCNNSRCNMVPDQKNPSANATSATFTYSSSTFVHIFLHL